MALSHDLALRDLNPLDMCEQVIGDLVVPRGEECPCEFCSIRRVDAGYLDGLQEDIESSLASVFSFEQSGSLEDWEKALGLHSDSSLTEAQRWIRVRSARTRKNGLSKPFFEGLAADLGYTITIHRGVYPFRFGISKIGIDPFKSVDRLTTAPVGDPLDIRNRSSFPRNPMDRSQGNVQITPQAPFPSDFWTWEVEVISLGANPDASLLMERFEALKPHYSQIVWR